MSSTHKDTERYQGATATEQAMVVGGPLDYLRYNYFLRLTMVKPEDAKEKDFSKALKRYINAGPLFYKHNPNIGFFVGRMYQNRLLDADTDKSRLKAFDIF